MATAAAMHPSNASAPPQVPAHQVSVTGLPQADDEKVLKELNGAGNPSIPRGPVTATMNFYEPPKDGSNPFNYVEDPPEGQPQRNFGAEEHDVRVHDARGREEAFVLDEAAFSVLQGYPHNDKIDWDNDDSVKTHYYPEVEKILLENVPGSKRILLFDHTVRRANPDAPRAPVTRAHIDQTAKSAMQRVRNHCPDEADELLNGRYRIINVWRPINGAVESSPLAFAHSKSVPDDDMVPVEHRYPKMTGETAAIRYNKDHEWWYWSGIEENERILLQCYDSKQPMNRVPHTAFVDPRSTEKSKPRESIEVRALIFG